MRESWTGAAAPCLAWRAVLPAAGLAAWVVLEQGVRHQTEK
jgi:hypothetical protein